MFPSSLTLVINLGDNPDPAVSEALQALLLKLAQANKESVSLVAEENDPSFDVRDLRDYLVEHEGNERKQAYRFAERAITMLLRKLADEGLLIAYCKLCKQRRGVCTCDDQVIWASRGETLRYYTHPLGWVINQRSFLTLTPADMRHVSNPAAERLLRFAAHLREQKTA